MIAEKRRKKKKKGKNRFARTIGVPALVSAAMSAAVSPVVSAAVSAFLLKKYVTSKSKPPQSKENRNGFFSFTNYYKIAGICVLILIY